MKEQKDKPMPDIVFKVMSFIFVIRDRFRSPAKQLQEVGIKEGQTVLDYGCGPGSYAIPAAKLVGEGGTVYALDIHPLAIEAVERKAKKSRLANITTILSGKDTGLPGESMDVVLAYDMIHSVRDKRALLEELYRVMKPEGLLSIAADHIKPEAILEIAEKDGLFSLRDRHGNLLNLEKNGDRLSRPKNGAPDIGSSKQPAV